MPPVLESESSVTVARAPRIALYAGVFDPPTLAHLEIVETALGLFDRLVVVVGVNPSKAQTMFSAEERVALLTASLSASHRQRVEVMTHEGLTAPLAERLGACALVRGMRPVTDPDYEIALSLMNAKLAPSIPTVLLVARADHVYLSSTFVRDTARLGGIIVPGSVSAPVAQALRRFFPRVHTAGGGALSGAEDTSVSPVATEGQ